MKRREFFHKAFCGMGTALMSARERHPGVLPLAGKLSAFDAATPSGGGIGIEATGSSTIRFKEITRGSGVQSVEDSDPTPNKNQPETMVAGVALLDYDRDGYLDIYLISGGAIPSLPGAVGTFEGAFGGAITLLTGDQSTALAVALIGRLYNYLNSGLIGGIGLLRDGQTLSGIYGELRKITSGKDTEPTRD